MKPRCVVSLKANVQNGENGLKYTCLDLTENAALLCYYTHQAAAIIKCKKLRWVCGYQIPNEDIKSDHWKVKMKSPTSLFWFFNDFSPVKV